MSRKRGEVEQAVWRDLDPVLRRTALAMATYEAARQLDDGVVVVDVWGELKAVRMSARDTALLVRELRASLAELRKLKVPAEQEDSLAKRRARRAAARGAAG
jgi:hypothetical protein